ncbi:CDP-alcohol phosphatidyltransferase family protein [Thermogemmata fonticola]|uniref:CDP-diacylglycerol--glycerol-3-phosphate 3-phosphatidyltransferase n=1 Tax=Thermogemmata fonticola TaxID=2755323 RepID=A0A7V8VGX0_9BACT|nr:CDP-alcohol phosphatidyltransferase family protein [Thermogemmata fonticola]MBA2227592.1 CDP-alcohol phosphatidyltransferase family protein [Thermogemmata fonticola]
MDPGKWWIGVPDGLSLSRLPLAVVLCGCIACEAWWWGLGVLLLAAGTDFLDGWWARRYGPQSLWGRSLDPLTDKVLTCSAFIYLSAMPGTGILPAMTAVIVGRELLVTGLRGIVESAGRAFGADWGGKVKTVSQFAVLVGVLARQGMIGTGWDAAAAKLDWPLQALIGVMLAATVVSGLHYLVKAARLLRGTPDPSAVVRQENGRS